MVQLHEASKYVGGISLNGSNLNNKVLSMPMSFFNSKGKQIDCISFLSKSIKTAQDLYSNFDLIFLIMISNTYPFFYAYKGVNFISKVNVIG